VPQDPHYEHVIKNTRPFSAKREEEHKSKVELSGKIQFLEADVQKLTRTVGERDQVIKELKDRLTEAKRMVEELPLRNQVLSKSIRIQPVRRHLESEKAALREQVTSIQRHWMSLQEQVLQRLPSSTVRDNTAPRYMSTIHFASAREDMLVPVLLANYLPGVQVVLEEKQQGFGVAESLVEPSTSQMVLLLTILLVIELWLRVRTRLVLPIRSASRRQLRTTLIAAHEQS
jgi:hypothetical protein